MIQFIQKALQILFTDSIEDETITFSFNDNHYEVSSIHVRKS